MKGKFYILGAIFCILSLGSLRAQGSLCSDVEPFCAGDQRLTFPNSNFTNSSQISGELGPDYGCLEETPYPAWFFLQVEEAGDLRFTISQYTNNDFTGAPLDVDFVVWGPFERGEEYCAGGSLNSSKIVDCSYLPDAVETMIIPNAMAAEIYVVVITNFEQTPGFISLQQQNTTNGGSTDCSILESTLGDDVNVCGETEYTLDGTTDEAEIYEWYVYNEAADEYDRIPGEDEPFLTVTESGNYRLVVTDDIGENTDEDEVNVTFYDNPQIGESSDLYTCQAEAETIDLTQNDMALIAPNSNSNNYNVFYYSSIENLGNNEFIPQPQSYLFEDGALIYAKVEHIQSGCLSESVNFKILSFDFPEFQLQENMQFCVDLDGNLLNPFSVGEDLGNEYTYEWTSEDMLISNDPILNFNDFPSFSEINLRIKHLSTNCEINLSTTLVPISKPQNVSIEISGSDFGEGYTVTTTAVDALGIEFAEFAYQLDDTGWQESNIFTDVPPGTHTVKVRETNGCGITQSDSFVLIGYPRYFTPNSDGYHDYWNVINDLNVSIKRLYIFDRYGKLIKQLDPTNSKGWDGTYNSIPLAADDYWFRVEFVDQKTGEYQEYMANFTLIR